MIQVHLALLLCPQLPDFEPRFELGQRVRALEREFLEQPEQGPRRRELIDAAERAVERFFRGDFAAAAQAFDGALGWPPGAGWVLLPQRRLVPAEAEGLDLWLWRWYGPEQPRPAALELSVGEHWQALEALPEQAVGMRRAWRARLPLEALPGGDQRLRLRVRFEPGNGSSPGPDEPAGSAADFERASPAAGERNSASEEPRSLWLSVVPDLEPRLAALEAGAATLGPQAPALEAATLAGHLELLRQLASGPAGETEFPAARLLEEAEALLDCALRGRPWLTSQRSGEHWISVPTGKRPTRVRLWLPPDLGAEAGPGRPLVLALHGAGGSENLFFDGHGDGLIRRLCAERGWILAAPRLGLLGGGAPELLPAALAERLPIDLTRVFVVGHSMGAARALSLAREAPGLAAALVLLGGGRPLRDPEALRQLPIWIAAGERDFGRPGAEALQASLARAAAQPTAADLARPHELWIVPQVEHLLVVPAALPRAFAWLDARAPRQR